MAVLTLRILGPLTVWRAGTEVAAGPPQQQCLLALLLAREGHPVTVDDLVDRLWGSAPPPTAKNVIQKYVGALRRILEPGLPARTPGRYLARRGDGYRFSAGPEVLDLSLFRRLVAEARVHAARGELDRALDHYADALRLQQGRAGDGLGETPAARSVLAGLDDEYIAATLAAAEIAAGRRQAVRMLAPLRRAAEMDPLNESVQAGLITTLAAAGRRAEAVLAYGVIRGRLGDELGLGPGPELVAAHQRVMS